MGCGAGSSRGRSFSAASIAKPKAWSGGDTSEDEGAVIRKVLLMVALSGLAVASCTGSGSSQTSGTRGTGGTRSDAEPSENAAYDIEVDPYGACPLVAVVNLRGIKPSDFRPSR